MTFNSFPLYYTRIKSVMKINKKALIVWGNGYNFCHYVYREICTCLRIPEKMFDLMLERIVLKSIYLYSLFCY